MLERELYNYFDRLSVRPSTINNGGIRHTYSPFEIPPGFELDPETQIANFPLENDYKPLIRFLVEERLYYTWDNGQRSTLGAINNIIDPKGENKSFDDVFLEDVITVNTINAQQETSEDFDDAVYTTNIFLYICYHFYVCLFVILFLLCKYSQKGGNHKDIFVG